MPKEIGEFLASFNDQDDPEFRKFVEAVPDKHWSKYDLSALRMGWEAHKEYGSSGLLSLS